MAGEKTKKNFIARLFALFKSKRARNILYFLLIAFATLSMFFIDKENTFRKEHLAFLDNNFLADLMGVFGVERYNVTSGAWVLFIILMTVALMILIGNIIAPHFIAKKVQENPNLFSTEKKTRAFYRTLFYGVLVLIAGVIVLISYIAGAFDLYGANKASPFISLLIMLAIFLGFFAALFIAVIIVYLIIRLITMAIAAMFGKGKKKEVKTVSAEPIAEMVASEAVKEEKAAAPVVKTKKPVVAEKPAPAPAPNPKIVINDIERVVIQKSFAGKLSQATKVQKEYYNELKNHFLSFKGVNSRLSNNFDSFNIGRSKAAKIAFRGETMVVYFALNPKDYVNTKYYPHDMSKKKKFADTPMMVKVKSARGVKFAKELINEVCSGLPAKKNFVPETYKFPYMSDKKLVEKGLAKEIRFKI